MYVCMYVFNRMKSKIKKSFRFGDNVVICSRSQSNVDKAVRRLKKFCSEIYGDKDNIDGRIFGTSCDVSDGAQVQELVRFAQQNFANRSIDIWINNAGVDSGVRSNLSDLTDESIASVVDTNLTGTLLCCKYAFNAMAKQQGGGWIYIMEGYGSSGNPSPKFVPYGSTKACFRQLSKSLNAEMKQTNVVVNRLSPGIVVTELITKASEESSKKIFNILADTPHEVAQTLVPRIRSATKKRNRLVAFLTGSGVAFRFATAFLRKNRFWNAKGEFTYIDPYEQIECHED